MGAEACQSLVRRRVIGVEEEERRTVASEVEGHHSLVTPGWETGREREAKKVGGNAVVVVSAPS